MIDFIRGRVAKKGLSAVVIESGGIGYALQVPLSTLQSLNEGDQATVLTHLHLRENEIRLFGFATEMERELFLQLIEVPGIGPSIAITALSSVPASEFYRLVQQGDPGQIAARVKGMGKKRAEQVILELKNKVGEFPLPQDHVPSDLRTIVSDAVKGLVALGSTRPEAEKAVQAALKKLGDGADAEALFRHALAMR